MIGFKIMLLVFNSHAKNKVLQISKKKKNLCLNNTQFFPCKTYYTKIARQPLENKVPNLLTYLQVISEVPNGHFIRFSIETNRATEF